MDYAVRIARSAQHYFDKLPPAAKDRIRRRLRQLAAAPFSPRYSKILKNAAGRRAARVGDWRILFFVDEPAHTVNVTAIGPRGDIYRGV